MSIWKSTTHWDVIMLTRDAASNEARWEIETERALLAPSMAVRKHVELYGVDEDTVEWAEISAVCR